MLVSKDNFYDYIQVLLAKEKYKNNPMECCVKASCAILQLRSFKFHFKLSVSSVQQQSCPTL